MRIALVTREYPPETAWGGIGKFYGLFAGALRDAGHEVEVFTQGLRGEGSDNGERLMVYRVMPRKWVLGSRAGGDLAGMGAKHLGVFALSLATAMLRAVWRRHRRKPFDLVEGHEHLGINALVNIAGRRRFVTVSRYHTAYHSLVSRGLANWPPSGLIRRLEAWSIRSAHARLSASAFIDRMTRQDFAGAPPCDAVIPLLPDLRGAAANPPLPQRERLMVFVGRLMPGHKNPEMAAQAFSSLADRFPDWRIEFAGLDIALETGGSSWQRCEAWLARHPGRYCYHGALAPERLPELYGRARIALIPSGFESFGLVALESMAAGTVPVVADSTALPEVVGEAGVVFQNGSLRDLCEKLEALLGDEGRQQALSGLALARVREEFSEQQILARNTTLFERLIRSGRRGNR